MAFQRPFIDDKYKYPCDVVFVLDEFDIGILCLAAREKRRLKKQKKFKRKLERYIDPIHTYKPDYGDDCYNDYYDTKVKMRSNNNDSIKIVKLQEDGKKSENIEKDEKKDLSVPALKEDNEEKEKDEDLSISTSSDEFCVKDLLEILQGVIPLRGAIVFATTNDFSKIKNICPALFRRGRLTPVEFGYLDDQTLTEITKYF